MGLRWRRFYQGSYGRQHLCGNSGGRRQDEVPESEELYDCPEMFESRFAPAIRLTLKARHSAQEYLEKDIDKMNFTL